MKKVIFIISLVTLLACKKEDKVIPIVPLEYSSNVEPETYTVDDSIKYFFANNYIVPTGGSKYPLFNYKAKSQGKGYVKIHLHVENPGSGFIVGVLKNNTIIKEVSIHSPTSGYNGLLEFEFWDVSLNTNDNVTLYAGYSSQNTTIIKSVNSDSSYCIVKTY